MEKNVIDRIRPTNFIINDQVRIVENRQKYEFAANLLQLSDSMAKEIRK